MKWTIRLELTPDGNRPITYDIGTITRPIADLSPEEIGLTLEEGQQLLAESRYRSLAARRTPTPSAEDLACIVGNLSALRTSAPNAFKQFSAPFDFGNAGIGPAVAATILTGTANTSRWVKSFRGGQRRRCAICLPNLGLGCRIARRPGSLMSAVSAICVQATWRFAVTRWLSAGNSRPNDLTRRTDRPSKRLRPPNPW
jgi:hypothetical protein